MTYNPSDVLSAIDNSLLTVLIAGAISFVGYYFYYIQGIRMGFRDKTHGIPVFANMYFFAHDVAFVGHYDRWFNEVDHWLFKVFWVALALFAILEFTVHYQTIKFSKATVFPNLTGSKWLAAYIGLQLAIAAVFWFIFNLIEDYLFLIQFTIAVVVSVALMPLMLRHRQSSKGQSQSIAWALIVTPSVFFFGFLPQVSPYFLGSHYVLMGLATVGVGIWYMLGLRKMG